MLFSSSCKLNSHQESPTKELVEHGFSLAAEGERSQSKPPERISASDDSSDGNVSEESEWNFLFKCTVNKFKGGIRLYQQLEKDLNFLFYCGVLSGTGYEWEDDFPLLPLPTSSGASDSPPPRSIPKAPDTKPAVQYSRFTVSPSNMSRFSITHISDSDVDSAWGGSSTTIYHNRILLSSQKRRDEDKMKQLLIF